MENISHPRVYWEVCEHYVNIFAAQEVNFVAKLSKGKYDEFSMNTEQDFKVYVDKLYNWDFVDLDNHMTYWRNQAVGSNTVVFLLGTEAVEDRGGLADFYTISPAEVTTALNDNYADWFSSIVTGFGHQGEDAINKLFETIFRYAPKDLLKLSNTIDELAMSGTFGVDELIAELMLRLWKDWRIPNISSEKYLPKVKDLCKGRYKLIEQAIKFRDRQDYKDSLTESKFKKISEQVDSWIQNNDFDDIPTSIGGYFADFYDFRDHLIQYIKGENLKYIREKICASDFGLIQDILQFKINSSSKKKKTNITKVYGNPLVAVLKILLMSMDYDEHRKTVKTIVFDIKSINLVNCSSEEELKGKWQEICRFAGGIFCFLQKQQWLNGEEEEICLKFGEKDNFDYFSPSNTNDLVTKGLINASSKSQKLNKVELQIHLISGDKKESYLYIWEFGDNADWVPTFTFFNEDLYKSLSDGKLLLPFSVVNNFAELIDATNVEDFFNLIEKANIDNSINILNIFEAKLGGTNNDDFLDKLRILAKHFRDFYLEVYQHGLFNTFNSCRDDSGIKFIEKYCETMRYLIENDFTSQVRDIIYLMANAFVFAETEKNGILYKGMPGVIIPPYHPAMLEKMLAQFLFLREGVSEIYKDILEDNIVHVQKSFKQLEQLSTITSSTDIMISEQDKRYLKSKFVYGYYALYGTGGAIKRLLSSSNILDEGIIDDEEFNTKELIGETPVSKIICKNIIDYIRTFPSHIDGVKLLFINPADLRSVISGVHSAVENLEKSSQWVRFHLQVLMPSWVKGGRSYLSYWLDNFFNEERKVEIETNFMVYDDNALKLEEHLNSMIKESDISYVQNILDIKSIEFEGTKIPSSKPIFFSFQPRFPMVFTPLPVFKTSVQRKTLLSQHQFAAAHVHTQLVRLIEIPSAQKVNYLVVQQLELSDRGKIILNVLHAKSRWVVCLDPGIDKELMKIDGGRIISFSTGEGPYGELNVTISAREEIQQDLQAKLKRRLKQQFADWDEKNILASSEHCLNVAAKLDGIKVLKALNPRDYEIHNFLAYLLTAETLRMTEEDDKYLVRSLIHLDSYTHWFEKNHNRPDFLLFEVVADPKNYDTVTIDATLIECKMGVANDSYVEKAKTQLKYGYKTLSEKWNPQSNSVEKRFWFAQLYRAIVFSVINRPDYSNEYLAFTNSLQQIIDGNFNINWKGIIYTYWLDYGDDLISHNNETLDDTLVCDHFAYGQLFVQKKLLPTHMRDQNFRYILPVDKGADEEEQQEDLPNNHLEVAAAGEKTGTWEQATKEQTNEELKVAKEVEVPTESLPRGQKELDRGNEMESTVSEPRSAETEELTVMGSEMVDSITPLEAVRILIGEDIKTKEKVYWEYGHPQLPNRHILISGNSGSGKTYCIQCLLLELSKVGISSIIFDYTDGFTLNKLEAEFRDFLGEKLVQFPVYLVPFPINPFLKYPIEIAGISGFEKDVDVAERLMSVFQAVYKLGDQQAACIYRATKEGLHKYKEKMNLEHLRTELKEQDISNAKTVLSKIEPLIDRNPFDSQSTKEWKELREQKGSVFVIQLSGFTREIQLLITELILWDAWYYNVKEGSKDIPFPVILDEAQNLDHREKSPTARILTEGRKFGWSGWFATQFMKDQMNKDEIQRLQQSSQKIYFCPPEAEIIDIASSIEVDKNLAKDWHKKLAQLRKGECIVVGYRQKGNTLEKSIPRILKVTALKERIVQ